MKKVLIIVAMVFALSLTLTACGGGGSTTNLSVDMVEFMFTPAEYTVPAGQEISLELTNNGAVTHDFIIMKLGIDVGQDFGEEDEPNIYWKAEQGPGTAGSFTFTAPSEPGEYQVICGVPGHYLAGMVGKLKVVAE